MSAEEIFEQRMRLGRLFDIYGSLLTAKQRQCLGLYFYDDLSLSEISEELGVSRQAVHDLLKRVEQLLERYEASLRVLAKQELLQQRLQLALELLRTGSDAKRDEAVGILEELSGEGR